MNNKLPTRAKLLLAASQGLIATSGFETRAGQCKRWIRQVTTIAQVPAEMRPPFEIDARQCAEWYRTHHPELCVSNGDVPGDLLFYENGHGPHGHVGIRLYGNVLGENSTAHAPEDEPDGRGTRRLWQVGKPSLVVRLWQD
jgi:hypothetical protein